MKKYWLRHISVFLLVLSPIGPILWSAHLILKEHANRFEVNALKFEKVSSPHWCSDFLYGEHRGLLPNSISEEKLISILVKRQTYLDVGSYIKTSKYLKFYVRGPPVWII